MSIVIKNLPGTDMLKKSLYKITNVIHLNSKCRELFQQGKIHPVTPEILLANCFVHCRDYIDTPDQNQISEEI